MEELQKKTDSTDAEKEELAKCEKEASEVKELIPDISTKVCVATCYSILSYMYVERYTASFCCVVI